MLNLSHWKPSAEDDGEFALFDGEGDVVVGGDGGGSHVVELGAVFHFDVCHVPLRFLVWRPCRFCLLFLIYD